MRALGVFIGFCMVACSVALVYKVNVKPDGTVEKLKPETSRDRTETKFDLTGCPNCKLALICVFNVQSCRTAKISVNDGQTFTQHCPDMLGMIFKNSIKNKMTVILENTGLEVGSFCQVKSTKPYIDLPEAKIDSSEHGIKRKHHTETSCKCGWTNKAPGRIVGGKEATPNEYPFPVLIIFADNGFPFCGGSIITPYHVLTAAHCTDPFRSKKLAVVVGEHDVRTRTDTGKTKEHLVKVIHQHEGYTTRGNLNDISILELATPIQYNDHVGPICMPKQQEEHIDTYIKVMGWGLTKDKSEAGQASPVLRKVNLRVIDPEVCKTIYNINLRQRTQICTYNNKQDSCQGDSGGPLVRHNPTTNMYEQVALVSYGRKCGSTDPAVNTDVAAFMPWIKQIVGNKGTMCS